MSGAADSSGFLRGYAAKAEVVQLEGKQRRIARADQSSTDHLLDRARQRCNSNGIPDLQENRFRPIRKPIKFRIGILNSDQSIEAFDYRAFLHGPDAQGKPPAVFRVERFEALVIEGFRGAAKGSVSDAASLFDIFESENLAGKIGFHDVLKHGQHGFVEHAAPRFDVGIDMSRI